MIFEPKDIIKLKKIHGFDDCYECFGKWLCEAHERLLDWIYSPESKLVRRSQLEAIERFVDERVNQRIYAMVSFYQENGFPSERIDTIYKVHGSIREEVSKVINEVHDVEQGVVTLPDQPASLPEVRLVRRRSDLR